MSAAKASSGKLWAVIMAGGSGTRFWPESRKKNPKQFLRIFGKKTLLEQTVDRLGNVIAPERIFVITQDDKVSLARKLLKSVPGSQILGEPVGRNTAPCAILAAAMAVKTDPQAVIALLPADHRIENQERFRSVLKISGQIAGELRCPVTFGVKPAFAHTGFGYLELGGVICREKGFPVYRLKRFHEKPDLKKASGFVRSGRFLWNSGMFVWKAGEVLEAAKKYLPKAHKIAGKIQSGDFKRGMKRFYAGMPNISIDYGLMEKIRNRILAIPVDLGWNDVGGWQSLADLFPKDKNQNVVSGKTLLVESEGNIVRSSRRLTVLLGAKDLVVVDTPDALLVCPKSKTESIRKVVQHLQEKGLKQYL